MSSIALTHLGILQIEGEKASSFLQGQVTCDVESLTPPSAGLGGYCNIKGRLLCTFYCLRFSPSKIWLVMPKALIPDIQKILHRYGVFSRITLTDCSDTQFLTGHLAAPGTPSTNSYALSEKALMLPDGRHIEWGPTSTGTEDISEWITSDIEQLVPWIYPQTSGVFLPHHCHLVESDGVSFEKGCYLGQEVIARMHYRGNIKKHALALKGLIGAEANKSLKDSAHKTVGQIMYASHDHALCVVNDGVRESDIITSPTED
jgi:hypothetical protein